MEKTKPLISSVGSLYDQLDRSRSVKMMLETCQRRSTASGTGRLGLCVLPRLCLVGAGSTTEF